MLHHFERQSHHHEEAFEVNQTKASSISYYSLSEQCIQAFTLKDCSSAWHHEIYASRTYQQFWIFSDLSSAISVTHLWTREDFDWLNTTYDLLRLIIMSQSESIHDNEVALK